MLAQWRGWARRLKQEVRALWLASRDPRTPWYARVVVACVVAYALSPIDLIPDFIPVVGYLDDLLLVPLGIALAVRLIPPLVLAEARQAAAVESGSKPKNWLAAAVIVAVWVLLAALGVLWAVRRWR